jgi:hypothetical protein
MGLLRENAVTKLATLSVDLKTVAITEIFVVPVGKSMIVTGIVLRVTAFTVGSKSVQAIISFGANSATYDDYLHSVTYTITAVSKAILDNVLDAEIPVYAAGSSFRISVETGSNATTETASIDLLGYLV